MSELNKKASKAGLWYVVGNMLLKGCVFLTLPIFTRLLSTADFGIYNTYIAYEGLLSAVLGLGLYGTLKNAKLDFGKEFDNYVSSVFSLSLYLGSAVIIIANLLYPQYGEAIGFSRLIINCLILQSFGTFFIHFYGVKLNAEFKYKPFLTISIFNTIGSIIVSILLIIYVFPNERYLGRIIGSASFPIIITIIVGSIVFLKGRTSFSKTYWKYAIAIGLPLVPHVISQSLLSQFDRIMITNMVGESQAGIYSYMYTICTITNVICLSMDNAWTPWLFYKIHDDQLNEAFQASKKYIEGFAIISIGFICFMPEVAKIIAPEDYWSGIDLLVPLTMANYCIFLYLMPVSIEYYNKKTAYISVGTIGAALLNLILNYFAIKTFGFKAAAYTTLISYFALFILHSIVASKFEFKRAICFKHVIVVTSVVLVVAIFVMLSAQNRNAFVCVRLLVLIGLAIYIWKNRKLYLHLILKKGIRHEN